MRTFIHIPFALLFAFIPACADKPEDQPKEKKEESTSPKLVGRVASIPAGRKFVLIQAYGTWTVETGSILTTQGPGERMANLRATGEKLGQYAAADIQSGSLEVGDGVYTVAAPPKQTSAISDVTDAPATDEGPEPAPAKIPAELPDDQPSSEIPAAE